MALPGGERAVQNASYNTRMETTKNSPLDALGDIPIPPEIAALPKADLHLHQQWSPRLDRVLARREGRPAYDWRGWARRVMEETPPGIARLRRLGEIEPTPPDSYDSAEHFVAWVEDALDEAATDGAVLVEERFGKEEVLRPGFMALFREAERRVQARHPALHAEAIIILMPWQAPELLERLLEACVSAAQEGLAGIDLLYQPYDTEADWEPMYRAAERAAEAGLGVTAHAGEFSTANIAAALQTPGLSRIGHAVYAARDPRLLDLLAQSGVTVECSLSCNVVLGAVSSYEEHPIRQFVESDIPVALCADVPVQIATTIGREYAVAHAVGFSPADLVGFTANAIRASFTPPARKSALLASLNERGDGSGEDASARIQPE
jgi:adenosine deaminase